MDPYNFNNNYGGADSQALDARVSNVMRSVYVKMFFGLLVTAAIAWLVANVATGQQFMTYMVYHRWVYWGLAIAEIGLVMYISARLTRMNPSTATALFYLFALVNGLTLSLIFAVYTPVSIFKTFLITAGTFGAMSVYGYFTEKDLTRIGSILTMALFGLIICCVVNIFWANSTFEWIVSGLGVIIFIGLTAYDTQKIKNIAEQAPGFDSSRLATIGALNLYLDFINLFLMLLRFFGNSRN